MLRPNGEDSAALDWRPAALALLDALDTEVSAGAWELVPSDGTEPIRATGLAPTARSSTDMVSVPLTLPDGSIFATLKTAAVSTGNGEARVPGKVAVMAQMLESLLGAHHVAHRARQRAEAAEAAALADPLTSLPNRRAWRLAMQVEEARSARSKSIALLAVVDLDGLKTVNDTDGHLAGDVLLRVSAQTLRAALRTEDVLARVGGDEFHVMAVDYKPPVASVLVDRLRAALDGEGIPASIGAAVRAPGEALSEALHRADLAMYDDKTRRRSGA
jgi:diguanylate cyclase (GGDEF)-like protein